MCAGSWHGMTLANSVTDLWSVPRSTGCVDGMGRFLHENPYSHSTVLQHYSSAALAKKWS